MIRMIAAAVLLTSVDAFMVARVPGRLPVLHASMGGQRAGSSMLTLRRGLPRSSLVMQAQDRPKVAVVGAGWGGWAAAKALCENGCDVTLFDTLPDPTGAQPMLTPSGKPFEPGTRGFWMDYPNIESLLCEMKVPINEVLTDFEPSAFYSPDGLEAVAPVFSSSAFPQLPSPLGQVFATFSNFKRLPVQDRVTMIGLLYAMLDFSRDEETFAAYDRMTAHELFIRMGLSKRLVDDFIRPTLLVGLFKPPEELSAAVAMELLYFYALAHQDSFDVRWVKKKSIQETMINPLARYLTDTHSLTVNAGCAVKEIVVSPDSHKVSEIRYVDTALGWNSEVKSMGVDACVLALGSKGMKAVVQGSPQLASKVPELSRAASLGAVDVVAARIWLDRYVDVENPANVLSRYDALRGAGGTFFMLDQLQPDEYALWGGEEPQGSVLSCDFYNAGAIQTLSDQDIVDMLMKDLLPSAVPAFRSAKVLDSYVKRFPGAVTWFSPGSYNCRPPMQTGISNLVCAGDWVRMGDREHGAKGLCQERAYVSGLEAANALARNGLLKGQVRQHPVIPIREDEPQVVLGREVNARVMAALKPIGLASPWVR